MYFRVCAVYGMNKFVVLFFGFTWLVVIAGAATPFGAMQEVHNSYTFNEYTRPCFWKIKHRYVVATSITDLINDSLILLAIMYKLGMADIRRGLTPQIHSAWKPMGHLQSFTKAFLQDSQIYYT